MNAAIRPVISAIAMLTAAATVAVIVLIGDDARSFAAPAPGPRPTIVLVHGAWADTSSWDGEVTALRSQGYETRAIANPLRNLTSDGASVASFLRTIDGPVVLVGHSYGGAVITEAAAGDPDVKALVYVDATAPDVGETNGSLSGAGSVLKRLPDDQLFDEVAAPGGGSDLYLRREVFLRHFAKDLPDDQATELWATQRTAAKAAFDTPATQAAWKNIPSWYFISSGDEIITPAAEHAMAQRAHAVVTEFPGGSHLTLVSNPDAVTSVITAAAQSVR
jgi:pimeloyl-ACP methyl ester carboxylesterase